MVLLIMVLFRSIANRSHMGTVVMASNASGMSCVLVTLVCGMATGGP